jgi:hypothetical protein
VDLSADAGERGGVIVQRRAAAAGPDPVAPPFRSWLEGFAEQLEDDEFAYSEAHGEVMYADEIDFD